VLPAAIFSVAFVIEVPSSSSAIVARTPWCDIDRAGCVGSDDRDAIQRRAGPVAPFSISSVLPRQYSRALWIEVPSSSSAIVAPDAVVPISIVLLLPLPMTVRHPASRRDRSRPSHIERAAAAMFSVAFVIEVPSSSSAIVAPDAVVPTRSCCCCRCRQR